MSDFDESGRRIPDDDTYPTTIDQFAVSVAVSGRITLLQMDAGALANLRGHFVNRIQLRPGDRERIEQVIAELSRWVETVEQSEERKAA